MLQPDRSADRDLVTRFREGDSEAFTTLYRAHSPAVFRSALNFTGDGAKAAEVTQDVFVWLIHHAGDYDPARGDLRAYLTGVTHKFLLRRQHDEMKWTELDERAVSPSDPAGELEAAEVRRAVACLPPLYRAAVIFCDLEGNTYEEAAAALGCATGTVRSRLHRARQLLGRKLRGIRYELPRSS